MVFSHIWLGLVRKNAGTSQCRHSYFLLIACTFPNRYFFQSKIDTIFLKTNWIKCFENSNCFLFLRKIPKVKNSALLLLLLIHTAGFCQDWNTSFDKAKSQAAAQNKNILLLFSGSDWCTRCMELEKTLWQTPEFKAEAEKNWVLLRADFLQKKGDPEPVDVNDVKMILAEKYNRDGFFPYMVVLDKNGKVLGKTGVEDFTAEEYIMKFRSLTRPGALKS